VCGITAIFDLGDKRPIDQGLVDAMTDAIAHRGPDGRGTFVEPGIALGHRRLSIIDIDGGGQPMFAAEGKVALSYNGEIYNFLELRQELIDLGAVFKTRCDTEVVLQAWLFWGAECVTHFDGMFAFALWDARSETLFLARDRLGKKPLYYSKLADGRVLVASELKALMVSPDLPRALDPQAVEDFFAYGYVPDPKTIFSHVKKLPPAQTLTLTRNQAPKLETYWHLDFAEQTLSEAQAAEATRQHLAEATRSRLIADVPLGAFLSGGVDSSAVVAMMACHSDEPVKSFSISFDEAKFDESQYDNEVAERYQTDHHVRLVDPNDFSQIDRLTDIFDEPFGDSSALPTLRVCEVAREKVTVCLSGDGGDELFGGYRRHGFHLRQERLKRHMSRALRQALFGSLGRVYPKLDWAPRALRAKTTLQELAMDEVSAYFNGVAATSDADRAKLFSDRFRQQLQGYHALEVVKEHMSQAATDDPLARAQYVDIKTWLPGDILTKVDRTSMSVSLEVRAPLLDHRIAQFGLTLPSQLKIRGAQGKYILKKALQDDLPESVLYRPKQGFSVPLAAWFRGPLSGQVRQALTGARLRQCGLFDMDHLGRMSEEHESGRRDHARTIWLLIVFESFLRSAEPAT